MTNQLGFNPLDQEGWRKAGLDPAKGIALAAESFEKDGRTLSASLFIIGVSDQSVFDKTIKKFAKDKERAELFNEQRYKQARIITILRQTPGGERPLFAYAFYEGYCVFSNAEGIDAIKKMVDRRLEKGLDKSQNFANMTAKLELKPDCILFLNESAKKSELPAVDPHMQMLIKSVRENVKGVIASVSLEEGIAAEIFLGLSSSVTATIDSYLRSTSGTAGAIMDNIGGEALALAKVSIDFQKMYSKMKQDAPAETAQLIKVLFGKIDRYINVNIEDRLVPSFGGDLVYSIFMGNPGRIEGILEQGMNADSISGLFNSAMAIGLSDTVRAMAFSLGLEEALKAQKVVVNKEESLNFKFDIAKMKDGRTLAWGVKNGLLLAALGQDNLDFKKLFSGGQGGKIVDKISSGRIRNLVSLSGSQVLYVNFTNIASAIGSIKPEDFGKYKSTFMIQTAMGMARDLLSRFDDGVIGVRPVKDGLKAELFISLK